MNKNILWLPAIIASLTWIYLACTKKLSLIQLMTSNFQSFKKQSSMKDKIIVWLLFISGFFVSIGIIYFVIYDSVLK